MFPLWSVGASKRWVVPSVPLHVRCVLWGVLGWDVAPRKRLPPRGSIRLGWAVLALSPVSRWGTSVAVVTVVIIVIVSLTIIMVRSLLVKMDLWGLSPYSVHFPHTITNM
jgi:hypothetical protein